MGSMKQTPELIAKRRARSSYVSTVIGISLVLFMLGSLCLVLLNAQKLSSYVKENIQFQVFIEDGAREVDVLQLKKSLDAEDYIRQTAYISKRVAADRLEKEIGEDVVRFLGYNPLLASIEVYLTADYAHPDSVVIIEDQLIQQPNVKEVAYNPDLIAAINNNINKISLVILAFSAVLMLISIALINNTVRLAMYSKRFTIKTMKLVGATYGFIRRPFLQGSILQGIIASFLAMGLIITCLISIKEEVPDFFELQDIFTFGKLFGTVVLLGIFITYMSTWFAVNKYLRLRGEEVY
ncbi:MAG: cell division transport system permease protein [Luteibaculaceae bacterium]|jgi:cell division transport system permease protein